MRPRSTQITLHNREYYITNLSLRTYYGKLLSDQISNQRTVPYRSVTCNNFILLLPTSKNILINASKAASNIFTNIYVCYTHIVMCLSRSHHTKSSRVYLMIRVPLWWQFGTVHYNRQQVEIKLSDEKVRKNHEYRYRISDQNSVVQVPYGTVP